MNLKNILFGIIFILILSVTVHLIFSWIGFVPSDDGFMLAYSRRILDGQVPFKDFLSAQNVGTPILWIPFVYFGGAYTFWITRFVVWFEFASIAWIWTSITSSAFVKKGISTLTKIVLALITFFFTAHSFPPMVWYTIDGLFIYSVALIFCRQNNKYAKMLGYFLVGVTYIIKQNFIFLLPATIFLLGDWKEKRYWISLLAPLTLFYGFFFTVAGVGNTLSQTTSRTEFVQTAIKGFVSKFTFPWGIMLGWTGTFLLQKKNLHKLLGFLLIISPVLYGVFYFHDSGKFIYDASFFLFGTTLGIVIYFTQKKIYDKASVISLGIMAAWTVAISGGYNTPVFASGILFLCIFFSLRYLLNLNKSLQITLRKSLIVILIIIFPISIASFYFLRIHNVYGEPRPATQLTYSVEKLLPGGKNIFVSKEIYVKLKDLQLAEQIAKKENKPYAILPAYAGMWVKSKQENPLPMDFPFITNSEQALVQPLMKALKKDKGKVIIIVDKSSLSQPEDYSSVAIFPISLMPGKYYQKLTETKYFVLYQ
jgi:hypothetical protein